MKVNTILAASALILLPLTVIAAQKAAPLVVPTPAAPDAAQIQKEHEEFLKKQQADIDRIVKETAPKKLELSPELQRRPLSKEETQKRLLASLPPDPPRMNPPIATVRPATDKIPDGWIACEKTKAAEQCKNRAKAMGGDKYMVKLPASGKLEELNAFIDAGEASRAAKN